MTNRDGTKPKKWWERISRAERALVAVALLVTIIGIILFIVVYKNGPTKICNSLTCQSHREKLMQRLNTSVDPCDDFYEFACGTYIANANGDESLNFINQLRSEKQRSLIELYREDVRAEDHVMVKAAKTLFKKCMDEAEIEKDDLKTIQAVLKEIGGWPVVEGKNWKGENFDWLNATYKLRDLGYPYEFFFEIRLEFDPEDEKKYIFKIQPPYSRHNDILDEYSTNSAVQIIADIAKEFGAPSDVDQDEITKAYRFLRDLKSYDAREDIHQARVSVGEFQKMVPSFDWLKYINKIIGPKASIQESDYAIFLDKNSMEPWIELITDVSPRTCANFMSWKLIAELLPHLPKRLRRYESETDASSQNETALQIERPDFCFEEVQKRFYPSPMDIMWHRKNLPKTKREKVEQILLNIKEASWELFGNSTVIHVNDKKLAQKRIREMKIMVGIPLDYFEDAYLDELIVDMIELKRDSYLDLLAQATRNNQTNGYTKISVPTTEDFISRPYVKEIFDVGSYGRVENMMFVPGIITKVLPVDSNIFNYMLYPILGLPFADISFDRNTFSNLTRSEMEVETNCLANQALQYNGTDDQFVVYNAVLQSMAEKLSYSAYRKWTKANGRDSQLKGIDYTPEQLFWIFATDCRVVNPSHSAFDYNLPPSFFRDLIAGVRRNIHNFAEDFACPIGSRMNPASKCRLI